MLSSKLCIGTANFGSVYGITNKKPLKKNEIKKIFNFIKKKKIYYLDTAFSYKDSHKIIKNYINKRIKIITKIPKIPKKLKNIEEWLIKKIITEQNYFKGAIDTILVHDTAVLDDKKISEQIFNTFSYLRKKKIISNFGISVYQPFELDKYIDKYNFNTVQLPINLFNRSFISTNWVNKLKKKKIKIHIRSVFLQGLLTAKKSLNQKKFHYLKKYFLKLNNYCLKEKISNVEYAIRYVTSLNNIDLIVVGVRDLEQLKEIYSAYKKKPIKASKDLIVTKNKILDPRNW
jgi:aryl-alcohol dehydrogenase-like predicted oxidoreductase